MLKDPTQFMKHRNQYFLLGLLIAYAWPSLQIKYVTLRQSNMASRKNSPIIHPSGNQTWQEHPLYMKVLSSLLMGYGEFSLATFEWLIG
jgi:hypothetical protein